MKDKLIKADLHLHTKYSFDCQSSLEDIIKRCQEIGISCVAIADHGTAEGALRMKELAPFKVIVAEEILTPAGEVMGMFLKESIPSGIPLEEAIKRIKAQGGLLCIPHPFDTVRRVGLGAKVVESLVEQIDVIEVFNSRSPFPWNSSKARDFAQKYGIPASAGSDAHTIGEIGNAYVEMPDFATKEEFLRSLEQGKIFGRMSNPLNHFASIWARLKRNLSGAADV